MVVKWLVPSIYCQKNTKKPSPITAFVNKQADAVHMQPYYSASMDETIMVRNRN